MKVYLASRYSRRLELCDYRREVEAAGHEVTSRWLNGSHQIDASGVPIGDHGEALVEGGETSLAQGRVGTAAELRRHFVQEDVADVLAAECVVSFTEPPRSLNGNRGGRHVEFGIALATRKRLIVVGHRENLFHWLPEVEFVETWADALHLLLVPVAVRP